LVWRNGYSPWNLPDPNDTEAAKRVYERFLNKEISKNDAVQQFRALYQGRILKDPGYFSTTIDPDVFTEGRKHRLELVAPKEAKGLYLESISQKPDQKEILFKRGTDTLVEDVTIDDIDRVVYHGRIVP
jgi:uncharacterized protein YchJ